LAILPLGRRLADRRDEERRRLITCSTHHHVAYELGELPSRKLNGLATLGLHLRRAGRLQVQNRRSGA
jgi:hypothetical protein